MTFRVVQWTTGNIGRKSVHAIVEHSLLVLVGCSAWSEDEVGRDVVELCGNDELLGVRATDDVDGLRDRDAFQDSVSDLVFAVREATNAGGRGTVDDFDASVNHINDIAPFLS